MLGGFEDEVDGKIMTGFLGLRSKCCVFLKFMVMIKKYKTCQSTTKNTVKVKIWI